MVGGHRGLSRQTGIPHRSDFARWAMSDKLERLLPRHLVKLYFHESQMGA